MVQVTLDDYRWYFIDQPDGTRIAYKSVTFVQKASFKDTGYHVWLANQASFEQSRQVMEDAGKRGSRVHDAIETILKAGKISYDYIPKGYTTPLTPEELQHVLSFANWANIFQPIVVGIEDICLDHELQVAGTRDLKCIIDGGRLDKFAGGAKQPPKPNGEQLVCTVDWKTSANIYDDHKQQIAVYGKSDPETDRIVVVKLNARNKWGFQMWVGGPDEMEAYYERFKHTHAIFMDHFGDVDPKVFYVPETIELNFTPEVPESE
jgi:hypothetical protein